MAMLRMGMLGAFGSALPPRMPASPTMARYQDPAWPLMACYRCLAFSSMARYQDPALPLMACYRCLALPSMTRYEAPACLTTGRCRSPASLTAGIITPRITTDGGGLVRWIMKG